MTGTVTIAGRIPGGVRSAPVARWLAGFLWVTMVCLSVAAVVLAVRNGIDVAGVFSGFTAALVLFAVTSTTVGVLIVWRQPHNRIGWLLCAAVLAALAAAVGQYARLGLVTEPGSVPAAELAAWLNLWIWVPTVVLLMVFVPLLLPDGRLASPRWRVVAGGAGAAALAAMVFRALSPEADPSLPEVRNPYGINGAADALAVLETVGFGGILLAIVAAVVSLLMRFRRAAGEQRLQLKWVLYAAGLLLAAEVVVPLVGVAVVGRLDPTLLAVAETAAAPWLALAVGVAIMRYRLYDIDLLINRTVVYGALTLAVVMMYVVVVGYFGAALDVRGEGVSLLAAAVVAVLFAPLRARLQRVANRLVYGQRDEPYAVLTALGRRLETSLNPDVMLTDIVRTVREALKLRHAAIAVAGGPRVAAGQPAGTELRLPLLFGQEVVGELTVSPRSAEESFTAADRRLLDDFARQAAVAVRAVALTGDLQRARTQMVSAREEERRRLRRDLHDGLGPQLASQTLSLDAARALLRIDPAGADRLLTEIREQTRDAVAGIRRLVYDLRPPALDDRGLGAALREQADGFSSDELRITVTVPDPLPPLPAALDVAAYRIAMEALTNVVRHASASHCDLRVTLEPGWLTVTVSDDGEGAPPGTLAGVGWTSMRERADELTGALTIESGPGTTVRARLPLVEED